MRLLSARRLTGPSLYLNAPGVAVEIALAPGESADAAVASWQARMAAVYAAWQWPFAATWRADAVGGTLAAIAPVDQLETAVELAELAVEAAVSPTALAQARLARDNPALRHLHAWAHDQHVPFLWDDEEVTLGFGCHAQHWPLDHLPDPQTLGPLLSVPTALITGTNGKTTTARLLARLCRQAGWHVGNTSTDGWSVDEVLQEAGDWTGGEATRKVLRDPRVTAAVLETARGGLLRRGVALTTADVAVVTNISDDHLGERGVYTVAAMADAKLSVRHGVRPGGWLVLNAANAPLCEAADRLDLTHGPHALAWFAVDARDLVGRAGPQAWVADGAIRVRVAGEESEVARLADVPLTYGGAAPHNVQNALAAVLAGRAMGLADAQLRKGLEHFGATVADNPGRANRFHLNGATILVDFAHNPDGVRQIAALVHDWPAQSRTLLIGQAGDRSDELMHAFVTASLTLRPDRVVLKDTDHYLRGRQKGEIPVVLHRYYTQEGVAEAAIATTADEPTGIVATLLDALPGHLLILLIHDDFAAAIAQLRAAGAVEA